MPLNVDESWWKFNFDEWILMERIDDQLRSHDIISIFVISVLSVCLLHGHERCTASEPNLLKMRYKHRGTVERRNCSPLVARRVRGAHHHSVAGPVSALHLPPPPPLHHHQHAPPPAHSASSVVMAAKRMSQLASKSLVTNTHLVMNEFFNRPAAPVVFLNEILSVLSCRRRFDSMSRPTIMKPKTNIRSVDTNDSLIFLSLYVVMRLCCNRYFLSPQYFSVLWLWRSRDGR